MRNKVRDPECILRKTVEVMQEGWSRKFHVLACPGTLASEELALIIWRTEETSGKQQQNGSMEGPGHLLLT